VTVPVLTTKLTTSKIKYANKQTPLTTDHS